MKVLLINGSPHAKGCTYTALHEMEQVFGKRGVETELIHVGNQAVRGCIACMYCAEHGRCVFDDAVNQAAEKFEACDGLVVGSPVYYASANATLIGFLDRLFYSTGFDKTMKVGASVVSARRGGLSATFDELNKYFTICGMPDLEGLQSMRTLAENMTFLMKSIALGKETYGLPQREPVQRTNFIR